MRCVHGWFGITGLGLLLATAACNSSSQTRVSTSILFVDGARVNPTNPPDVHALAVAGEHVLRPIDGVTGRPVTVLGLIDVDVLHLRTDRGEEVVRVFGLGGCDPRLPDELNAYLTDVARPAALAWLTEPGTHLAEVSVPLYAERGASAGPSHRDADGRRLVTLQRHGADGVEDYQALAVARGWTYVESPYDDVLVIDPRLVFHQLTVSEGLHELECVQAMKAGFTREAEEIDAIAPEKLQEIGDRVHADVAEFLEWEPREPLTFVSVSVEEAREPVRESQQAFRDNFRQWLDDHVAHLYAEAGERGETIEVETEMEFGELEEDVTRIIDDATAFSPGGPMIYVMRKTNLSWDLLEEMLVHEVMHQYQEEVIAKDSVFPMVGMPIRIVEAQAEWLSMRYRDDRWPITRANGPMDYVFAVALFESVLEDTGLTHIELMNRFIDQEWEQILWQNLRQGEHSLQEWRFRQLGESTWEGISFEAVPHEDGLPWVRIGNDTDDEFRAQFHGHWIWEYDKDGVEGYGTYELAPFNTVLPAGASMVVQLGDDDSWNEYRPMRVTGLFSRTTPPPAD